MLAARWEPWTELNRLSREMDRLFARNGNGQSANIARYPLVNLWEDNDHVYAETELPGFQLSDLEIYVTGNQLTLKGERHAPKHESGTWHRQERGHGQFMRVVELPSDIDADNVAAEFKHGVLMITLPKSESVKPRRIEIKSN